jgi:hypothetical protein
LPGQERVDGALVYAKDAADANGVEAAVVDQTANRLGMDPELTRDFADAVQRFGLRLRFRHGHDQSRFTPKT